MLTLLAILGISLGLDIAWARSRAKGSPLPRSGRTMALLDLVRSPRVRRRARGRPGMHRGAGLTVPRPFDDATHRYDDQDLYTFGHLSDCRCDHPVPNPPDDLDQDVTHRDPGADDERRAGSRGKTADLRRVSIGEHRLHQLEAGQERQDRRHDPDGGGARGGAPVVQARR